MEQIFPIIREYAGSAYTKKVLTEIISFSKFMDQQRYFRKSGMLFRVDRLCVCTDACGGIRCRPILVFNMVGLPDIRLD